MYMYMYITPYVKPEHITPARNINNLSPARNINRTRYKYAPHTSTIHSDKTCGVRIVGGIV